MQRPASLLEATKLYLALVTFTAVLWLPSIDCLPAATGQPPGVGLNLDYDSQEFAVNEAKSGVSCFSNLSENELGSLVEHNATSAAITLCVRCAGPKLLACLDRQLEEVGQLKQVEYQVIMKIYYAMKSFL